MRVLDRLCGRWRWYRRLRGGTWRNPEAILPDDYPKLVMPAAWLTEQQRKE